MKRKILLLFISLILFFNVYAYFKYNYEKNNMKIEQGKLQEVISRYNEYVKTNKESNLYKFENGNYKKVGTVKKDYSIILEDQFIDDNTTHFKIKNMDLYIDVFDVEKLENAFLNNDRYKEYTLFNENIKTKEKTNFYNELNELVFSINSKFDFKVIIKEEDRYGIEFNDTLLFIKKEDVLEVYENNNTTELTRNNIRTFTYHTVYNKEQKCNSIEICHPVEQFDSHMKYLSENDYLTLTMEELEMFLNNKIRIRQNSVVITLDDGIYLENSIPIVEKYGVYATFFIITSKTDVSEYLDYKYAKFESHTDNLHNNYKCPLNTSYSQGGQMLCEKQENIVKDLKLSQDKLDGSYYFAFPFFDFNDNAKNALTEAGFKLAFIGQWTTNGYSDSSTDRYMIRRKTIFGNHTLNKFIEFCTDKA